MMNKAEPDSSHMLIYTVIPNGGAHTDSAISPVFALSYLHSLRYAEVLQ